MGEERAVAVLGIDPGFAALGLARVEYRADGCTAVDTLRTFRTAKSGKKAAVLATEDNMRRCQEIGEALATYFADEDVVAVCCESQSWPRNAGAAAKVAMAWGVLAEIARARGVPIVQASPQRIKLAACGRRSATKLEVRAAMDKRYPLHPPWPRRKADVEHAADALAAVWACRDAGVIVAVRRALGIG